MRGIEPEHPGEAGSQWCGLSSGAELRPSAGGDLRTQMVGYLLCREDFDRQPHGPPPQKRNADAAHRANPENGDLCADDPHDGGNALAAEGAAELRAGGRLYSHCQKDASHGTPNAAIPIQVLPEESRHEKPSFPRFETHICHPEHRKGCRCKNAQ